LAHSGEGQTEAVAGLGWPDAKIVDRPGYLLVAVLADGFDDGAAMRVIAGRPVMSRAPRVPRNRPIYAPLTWDDPHFPRERARQPWKRWHVLLAVMGIAYPIGMAIGVLFKLVTA
jgi:hypothetical protein